jgi:hypothetical protein
MLKHKCQLQYIQNVLIKSHLHATHFLHMSGIPDLGTNIGYGFINLTILNTIAYSIVVKYLILNVIFNTYKIFLLSLIYMQLISYV